MKNSKEAMMDYCNHFSVEKKNRLNKANKRKIRRITSKRKGNLQSISPFHQLLKEVNDE